MPDPTPPTRPAPSKQDTLSDQPRHALTTEADRLLIDPDRPAMRAALGERDVTRIFRLLVDGGMAQRQIAHLVKMNQSEVSEILSGRQVMGYDVLVRVADGLGVSRGLMGLAYTGGEPDDEPEEVDEDVERRKLLAIAGAILFGAPVFGEVVPLTVRRILTDPPSNVGQPDVVRYEQTVSRLEQLDREAGGMAARPALVATATAGEQMLRAQATAEVRTRLRYAVAEAHRLSGWASGDVGLVDQMRQHMHRALDFAAGSPVRVAGVLCSAGDMEKQYGAPNDALKMFQLAEMGEGLDPQAQAVVAGLSATAYQKLGLPTEARQQLKKARSLFRYGSTSQPFFNFYGPGSGLLAAGEAKLGDYDLAREDVVNAIKTRPNFDKRCDALDTIVLATTHIQAGELRGGIPQTQKALDLVREVGSQRVRDRLEPLETALTARNDSTCKDLARMVRMVRTPRMV